MTNGQRKYYGCHWLYEAKRKKKQRKRGGERRGDEELEGKEAILATGAEARDQTNN